MDNYDSYAVLGFFLETSHEKRKRMFLRSVRNEPRKTDTHREIECEKKINGQAAFDQARRFMAISKR